MWTAAVEIGKTVTGSIDWARRFDHMQQHSGEHICSGLICERFHCDNVGFHMGADIVTIDFNADISWEELLEIEAKANQYLYENHPIDIQFHRGAELEAIDYRSKKALEGDVRIVAFPGADCCACCGTHVLRSGQVGLVKFLSVQKFREGVRIELLCGKRALEYLSRTWAQAKAIGQRLSVKPVDSEAAVERLEGELASLKLRCAQLEESVFESIAKEQAGKGDVMLFQPCHAAGQRPAADGCRVQDLQRSGGSFRRRGGPLRLRPGPGGRTGHQPSGQGHEYGPPRAGRRTERLRSRQRGGGAERH